MSKQRPFPNRKGKTSKTEKESEYKDSRSNNPKNSRGRRNSDPRGYTEKADQSGAITTSGYTNDPAWYKRDGVLALDSSNISTYTPIGIPYNVIMHYTDFTAAGILRLDYIPHFGDVDGPTHPLMLVARDLYDFVNARNSRSSSYDPTDLMLYCIAVANAWVLHAAVRRIVGMFNTYSVLNRYWWDPVLQSMQIAPVSSTTEITHWVNLANRMAMVLNTLAVPKDITYFQRAQFMCESVFADSPLMKCSLYYFMPVSLLRFSYDSEGKGRVDGSPTPWANMNSGRSVTPAKVETYFNSLVENLINDTDISYMKADIRKAFGEENCYTLPQIDERFQHGYVYDGMVNLQVRNATVMSFLQEDAYQYGLYQDMETNSLVSDRVTTWVNAHANTSNYPSIKYLIDATKGSHLFDFPVEDVTNDMWIEATKLHSYFGNGERFHATTEVIVRDTVFIFARDAQGKMSLAARPNCAMPDLLVSGALDMDTAINFTRRVEDYSKFAAAPLQWIFFHTAPSFKTGVTDVRLNEDLTNYTTVDTNALNKMEDSAHISLFSWRDLAK